MGHKSINKNFYKSSLSKFLKKPNQIYIRNISLDDTFLIVDSTSQDSGLILLNIIISGISIMTMSQIAISARPENASYVDKLPSYKDIKKKFITSYIGRTLAACSGLAAAYPWLMQDPEMQDDENAEKIIQIVTDLVDNPSPNTRRIKPSVTNWQLYAKGEFGAAMGQMISCPSTGLKTINLAQDIILYGFKEAIDLLGINESTLEKFNITQELIVTKMREIYLSENSGLPINSIIYNEPKTIYSKIQNDILGNDIIRTGYTNSNSIRNIESNIIVTKNLAEKYLSSRELIAYKFAINTGDKNILKKYIDLVRFRSKKDIV